MAWIRWRGQSAQLMATVWEDGKSRQRYVASLGGDYSVPTWRRQQISARFPTLTIDWTAIQAAVVAGPPGAVPPSDEMLDWAAVEERLRAWALTGPEGDSGERRALAEAARVLASWRGREAQAAEAQQQRLALGQP